MSRPGWAAGAELPRRHGSLDPDGYVYVIEFSDGPTIKVGRTNAPEQRLAAHANDAAAVGDHVARYWLSPLHRDYANTERRLIDLASSSGRPIRGLEYFAGCDFDALVNTVESWDFRESTDAEREDYQHTRDEGHAVRYLSRREFAERIGVVPGALSRYKLPTPDCTIGKVVGWLPATIDAWQAARPGRGARTDLHSSR